MSILLPLALVLLGVGVATILRRSERPATIRLVLGLLLASGGGFLLGFLLSDVETTYYRSLVRGMVRATATALGDDASPADCEAVRAAYVAALEDSDRGEDFAAGWRVVRMLGDLPDSGELDPPPGSP